MMWRIVSVGVVALTLFGGVPAAADPDRRLVSKMDSAVNEALELYSQDDFAGAAAVLDGALDEHAAARDDAFAAWEKAAVTVRYIRALCMREQGDIAGARRVMLELADQNHNDEVRTNARKVLEGLDALPVSVRITCEPGVTYRMYAEGGSQGQWTACAAGGPEERAPGAYVIEWRQGQTHQARAVTLIAGQSHAFELLVPPSVPGGVRDCGCMPC